MTENDAPDGTSAAISARTGKILFAALVLVCLLVLILASLMDKKATATEEPPREVTPSETTTTSVAPSPSPENPEKETPGPTSTPTASPTKAGTTAPDTAPSLQPWQEDEMFLAEHMPLDRATFMAVTLSSRDWQITPLGVLGNLSTITQRSTFEDSVQPLVLGWDWAGCQKAKCRIVAEATGVTKQEDVFGVTYRITVARTGKAGALPPETWQVEVRQQGEDSTWLVTSVEKVA